MDDARNDLVDALRDAFPEMEDLARFRLANALTHVVERLAFSALDQALALVPLKVQAREAEDLAARLREVLAAAAVPSPDASAPEEETGVRDSGRAPG